MSKITISEIGHKSEEGIIGETKMNVYFTDQVSSNAYDLLLAKTGFSEAMIEPYFQNLSSYTSYIEGDHVVLKGTGVLMTSTVHNEINNNIIITEVKIIKNYSATGNYVNLSEEQATINMSFGPYLNIPLTNTELIIDTRNKIDTIYPQPDSSNGLLRWGQTPQQETIIGTITQQTPGYEILLCLIAILLLMILGSYPPFKKRKNKI